MSARPGTRTTTDGLVALLERRGLAVTKNMLGQDVKAGYLPTLTQDPRGPNRGIGRYWETWAVWRAIRLYRLRKHGVQGPVLRLLLFFTDGWGWDAVKPICGAGIRKLVAIESIPLNRTTRAKSNPTSVANVIEDAADGVFNHEEIPRFTWGMGLFGKPLEGGSLMPLFSAFSAAYGEALDPTTARLAEKIITKLGTSWQSMQDAVERADAETVSIAREYFNADLRRTRNRHHRVFQEQGCRDRSTNPLTFFGMPREELGPAFRGFPARITPAQLLGGYFVIFLSTALAVRSLAQEIPFMREFDAALRR